MQMMKRCLCALLLLGFWTAAYAQQPAWKLKENSRWKFYQYGGLHFDNNVPVPDTSAMQLYHTAGSSTSLTINAASVSDVNGDLLFYTDAYNIWNKQHQVMPGGTGLTGGNALDATLILPVIGTPGQYYIFYMCGTIDFMSASSNAYELRYTIVDMTLNNGLGDVVAGQKNVLLQNNLSGSIKAVPGMNCNIWLITHDVYNTQFKVFEVNNAGINTTPVTSSVGNGLAGIMGPLSFCGNLAVSHNGNRIAFAQNGGDLVPILELFDFNTTTAAVTNAVMVDTLNFAFGMSLCFSPDNQKLYLSLLNPGGMSAANPNNLHVESSLYQYNTALATPVAIRNSRVLVSDSVSSYNNIMRMGADGKIYMPASYGGDTSTKDGYFYTGNENPSNYSGPAFQAYLGCIQNPDAAGMGCSFNRHAVALPAYSSGAEALGGVYVKPRVSDSTYTRHDTTVCNPAGGSFILRAPSGSFNYLWDDAGTSNQRTVSASGTYYVRHGNYCHYAVDTYVVDMKVLDAVIQRTANTLSTTQPFDTYQWYRNSNDIPGATGSTYTITQSGLYQVAVTKGGCHDTSATFNAVLNGIDDPLSAAKQISVYPNPARHIVYIHAPFRVDVVISSVDGRIIYRQQNAQEIPLSGMDAGIYLMQLNDKDGRLLKVEKLVKSNQ